MKFPNLVHSVKVEPHNNIPPSSTGHNNFWDFISLAPESTHMLNLGRAVALGLELDN